MATKFVLLPEQNYKALLHQNSGKNQKGTGINDDLDEMSGLNFAKKKLFQTLKKKRKNLSTKNALINQRLRSYLKARKAIKDKPIKVTFGQQGIKIQNKGGKTAYIDDNGDAKPITNPEFNKTLEPQPSFEVNRIPITETPLKHQLSPTIGSRKHKFLEKEKRAREKIEQLADVIKNNAKKFGITERGQIINPRTNMPYTDSNLLQSLERILLPSFSSAPSPPGTKHLNKLINTDKDTKEILSSQKGSGKNLYKKKIAKNILQKFKPTKW